MSEANRTEEQRDTVDELIDEAMEAEGAEAADPDAPGLMDRFRKLMDGDRPRKVVTKAELGQDRTRRLLIGIGGAIGLALLLLGVLSTPPRRSTSEGAGEPNLGRRSPAGVTAPDTRPASVTPILSASVGPEGLENGQLSAGDILNTSSRDFGVVDEPEIPEVTDRTARRPIPDAPRVPTSRSSSVLAENLRPDTSSTQELPTFSYGNSVSDQSDPSAAVARLATSSIIFVRARETATPLQRNMSRPAGTAAPTLLPPGSRLIARLESAVTTALNVPVIAAIEYNYERGGVTVVPAGAKAIGELEQASASGHLGIRFHTLRMPDGREESFHAIAMSLEHEPLKGDVSGDNKVKRVLSRALSGVGTMAAYMVGGGGLSQPLTGGTLLRDRLATNIAQAGEQEFANAAYTQNIVVTIPAQTRFYIVLEEDAVEEVRSEPTEAVPPIFDPETLPNARELQELIDLKREIDRLYGESSVAQVLGME